MWFSCNSYRMVANSSCIQELWRSVEIRQVVVVINVSWNSVLFVAKPMTVVRIASQNQNNHGRSQFHFFKKVNDGF